MLKKQKSISKQQPAASSLQAVVFKSYIFFRFKEWELPAANCPLLTEPYLCAMKILMVCLGNICRSPLAEGILQNKALKAGLTWTVESAGTNRYHIGDPPHPLSQKVALLNGIDISQQRARSFKAEDFDTYDKIYALAEDVLEDIRIISKKKFDTTKVDLLMNEIYPGKNMDVPDPYYGSEEGYHEAYELIDKACDAIIKKYSILNYQYSTFK